MGIAIAKNGKEFNSDHWQTYQRFWYWLNEKYDYRVDLASSQGNAKCATYYTEEDNALDEDVNWTALGNGWCNPPYSRIGPWLEKGNEELNRDGVPHDWLVTFLIKGDATGQNYWVENLLDLNGIRPVHKIQFVYPRLPHVDPWGGVHKSNRFASALVHMTRTPYGFFQDQNVEWLDWRDCEQTDRPR